MEFFDSHTHLDAEAFKEDQNAVIERAVAAGVRRIVTIGASDGFKSAERAIALAERHSFIWASAGIHPHDAKTPIDVGVLEQFLLHPRVVAVGETGLDYFKDWSPRDLQDRWFRTQIEVALSVKKPLIIHSREAAEDCIKILRSYQAERVGGVFHCYSEDADFAKKLKEINFLVSIPGSVTFKKADKLRLAAKEIPLEQIMIETDAPYLAPEPHRGKRCETSQIIETARAIAKEKELQLEEIAAITTKTACKFFNVS